MPEVARHRRSVGVQVLQDFFSNLLDLRRPRPQKFLRVIDSDDFTIHTYTLSFTLSQEKSHLDTVITFMGAFFGMQNCSEVS